MHPHHKRALDKARADFKYAKHHMEFHLSYYQQAREYAIVRERTGPTTVAYLRGMLITVLRAIDDYQAQGEVLVCVERMLEKA